MVVSSKSFTPIKWEFRMPFICGWLQGLNVTYSSALTQHDVWPFNGPLCSCCAYL